MTLALSAPAADRTPRVGGSIWPHFGLIQPQIGLKTPRFGPELASSSAGAQWSHYLTKALPDYPIGQGATRPVSKDPPGPVVPAQAGASPPRDNRPLRGRPPYPSRWTPSRAGDAGGRGRSRREGALHSAPFLLQTSPFPPQTAP